MTQRKTTAGEGAEMSVDGFITVVVVVAILVAGFLVYDDRRNEREMNKMGMCAVQERNQNGGISWVYRPCASLSQEQR